MLREFYTYGNPIKYIFNTKKRRILIYADNDEEVTMKNDIIDHKKVRPCTRCEKYPTKEGHDACLGTLPGIKYACCGHGVTKPYVIWKDGVYCEWKE